MDVVGAGRAPGLCDVTTGAQTLMRWRAEFARPFANRVCKTTTTAVALSSIRRRTYANWPALVKQLICGVMIFDLTDEETSALIRLLSQTIDNDRYPLSPRVQTLQAILGKIRPERPREPLPPPKVYAPPRATAGRRRRAGR